MRSGAHRQSRFAAIICLVAFLLLVFTANVHVHHWSSDAPRASLADNYDHCAACQFFYSGAAQATFTQAFAAHHDLAAAMLPHSGALAGSQTAAIHPASRAPPTA